MNEETAAQPEETPEELNEFETVDGLEEALKEFEDTAQTRILDRVRKVIKSAKAPKRERVPAPDAPPEKEEWFRHGDVRDPTTPLYRSLPEAVREIRNPEVDHYIARFMRAVARKDWALINEASDKAEDAYLRHAGQRASTLYGTPDTTSGIGDGTGAPIVPLPLANLIVRARNAAAKIRSRAQIFTSAANTLRVPVTGVATAAMAAEGATAGQGEPTLTSKLLSKKKMQVRFVASEEMLQDSAFNLAGFYSERAGSAFGALEDVQFAASNGTAPNITESLASATITAVTEATSTVLVYEDVVKLLYNVPQQYHAETVFMGDSTIMQLLSQLVDGNSRPVFTGASSAPGVVNDQMSGQTGTIFGRPVLLVPTTAQSLFCGVLSNYGILDGGGMTIQASEHVGWTTDVMNFKVTQRIDGVVLLEESFREMLALATVA